MGQPSENLKTPAVQHAGGRFSYHRLWGFFLAKIPLPEASNQPSIARPRPTPVWRLRQTGGRERPCYVADR